MNKNKILTTTIGSFPKPDYLPIMDWFDSARGEDGMNTVKTTIEYTKYHNKKNESDELLFKRAANEVINIQIDAGIDVPTDGEIRRENYIHYHCRYLDGFDFNNLEHKVLRDGAFTTLDVFLDCIGVVVLVALDPVGFLDINAGASLAT